MSEALIGDESDFAPFVQITDASHGIDDVDVATKHSETAATPVTIGSRVRNGTGSMVMIGATIKKASSR